MRLTDSPPPVTVPFAQNGSRNGIPVPSQVSVTKGAASFTDGFPPLTMTSPLKGGIPPLGQDMNGILFVLSQIARWLMAGGSLAYDATKWRLELVHGSRCDPQPAEPGEGRHKRTIQRSGRRATGTRQCRLDRRIGARADSPSPRSRPVTTSGQYSDLSGTRTIPAAQVNADWNAASGPAQILNRPNSANVATTGDYADLTGEPVIATPPQFDDSSAAARSAFVQRALGSFSGHVTCSENATLDASHGGMAIQWAGADGGTLTLARTATLPLNAVAFLIYHHGARVLNLLAQGGDFTGWAVRTTCRSSSCSRATSRCACPA
ncbi:hypothetical protein [Caballeronia sp. AZ10_KS36]|uniref:hypothetical protein n=1 Tax=Caballeronia sp. AZ10_KS36 TaxID=2921757 RepID=UPI002027B48A|nr:hypothetical protein [Caballeronia sp. AZ10_KS36]